MKVSYLIEKIIDYRLRYETNTYNPELDKLLIDVINFLKTLGVWKELILGYFGKPLSELTDNELMELYDTTNLNIINKSNINLELLRRLKSE